VTTTLIARLTPPGKAAIATLAVRGPAAWEVTRQLFQPRRGALSDAPTPGRCWLGRLGGDDVLVAAKPAWIELHCHGGIEVVRLIEEAYVQHGVQVVPWQQVTDESPRLLDLLVRAPTTRTAAILLDQWQGAWESTADKDVQRLAQLVPLGQHLVAPWKIVIAGAPNVGKSSLMNALAGYTRSIVSPTPGTTRDVVSTLIAIDGWPIEMSDTAGIRQAPSVLEQQGIERAHDAIREADLRFWVLDGAAEPAFPEQPEECKFVINKTDLPAAWDWQLARNALRVSALTLAGLPELCEWVSKRLVPAPPNPGEAVPVLPEHVNWLRTRLAFAESSD
jgi:tRNA modification GTPase